ncbi:MAG: methylenetetrahydrofolate--tRNA-(uracil(54)-C(5))-methyltransferase (FADH(2)-oxidizing) TrmFO [Anaerolineaceae bacterium]|nr:MAG: methylenetetrahydrofolate--tRNA-(uracil(54)-C(5))-methyltransferase (FADH(2)-oxidizing) TrmFO [Anaerolineaceae bacterium]
MKKCVKVIGGGLAGSEAAWQIAERGIDVQLFEMRPGKQTGAHRTGDLAELVCSNSLGSKLPDRASGVLMSELRELNSLLLRIAEEQALPAGGALAVDRDSFGGMVTEQVTQHPRIEIIRKEVDQLPEGVVIVSSGPLTSERLSQDIARFTGEEHLYFFDALSPIVEADSIDMSVAFRASRYGRGQMEDGDYINCPFTKQEYEDFIDALLKADRIPLREFEITIREGVRAGLNKYFEACLPVEVIAERGRDALAYGPMRPVGLTDPRTGKRPYAVVQLRQDNLIASLYNLVGFQTNLTYESQLRVFRLIPGLKSAEFIRYGQMHRNTFINSPNLLHPSLQSRFRSDLFFAGQITGVEGYLGNIATGLLSGWNVSRFVEGKDLIVLPESTMLGSLCSYISSSDPGSFQPMKANFGILPPLGDGVRRNRRDRARAYADRSFRMLSEYLKTYK